MNLRFAPLVASALLLTVTVHCGSDADNDASPVDPNAADAAAPDGQASSPGAPPDSGASPSGIRAFVAGTSTIVDSTLSFNTNWQLADLNGDGKLDFAVDIGSWGTGFGFGDGNFQKSDASVAKSGRFRLAAAADFDGDGKDDLVGCGEQYGLRVFRGSATEPGGVISEGDFATFTFGSVDRLSSCATADFDGDGKPDVAIGSKNGSVRIGRNTGSGLTAFGMLTELGNLTQLIVFDVDGKNGKDLLAIDRSASTLRVLRNDGSGAFTATAPVALPAGTWEIVPFRESNTTSIAMLAGEGELSVASLAADGTLSAPVKIMTAARFRSVTAADINGDGKIEIAAAGNVIEVFERAESGWTVRQSIRATFAPLRIGLVDVDGDTLPDLVWLNPEPTTTFDVLPNTGDGTFVAPETIALDARSLGGGAFADVNGDGRKDVLISVDSSQPKDPQYVDVYLAKVGGGFEKSDRIDILAESGGRAVGFAFTDLTGDGKLDVVVRTESSHYVQFTGDGAGHFTAGSRFEGPPNTFRYTLGDIDGTPGEELIISTVNGIRVISREPGAFFNGAAKELTGESWPVLDAFTDVDGDGKLDLVVSSRAAGGFAIGRGLGSGSFEAFSPVGPNLIVGTLVPMKMGALPRRWLVLGEEGFHDLTETETGTTDVPTPGPSGKFVIRTDWSGDGIEDLVVGGAAIALYHGKADGSFEWSKTSLLGGGYANAVDVFDATGDGKPDIVVVNRGGGITVLAAR